MSPTEAANLARLLRPAIGDERVLAAIASIPRERFVPADERDRAYENVALPIGSGQTISQPLVVARMLETLALSAHRSRPRRRDRLRLSRGAAVAARRARVDDRAPPRAERRGRARDPRPRDRQRHVRRRRRIGGTAERGAVRRDQRRGGHGQLDAGGARAPAGGRRTARGAGRVGHPARACPVVPPAVRRRAPRRPVRSRWSTTPDPATGPIGGGLPHRRHPADSQYRTDFTRAGARITSTATGLVSTSTNRRPSPRQTAPSVPEPGERIQAPPARPRRGGHHPPQHALGLLGRVAGLLAAVGGDDRVEPHVGRALAARAFSALTSPGAMYGSRSTASASKKWPPASARRPGSCRAWPASAGAAWRRSRNSR